MTDVVDKSLDDCLEMINARDEHKIPNKIVIHGKTIAPFVRAILEKANGAGYNTGIPVGYQQAKEDLLDMAADAFRRGADEEAFQYRVAANNLTVPKRIDD